MALVLHTLSTLLSIQHTTWLTPLNMVNFPHQQNPSASFPSFVAFDTVSTSPEASQWKSCDGGTIVTYYHVEPELMSDFDCNTDDESAMPHGHVTIDKSRLQLHILPHHEDKYANLFEYVLCQSTLQSTSAISLIIKKAGHQQHQSEQQHQEEEEIDLMKCDFSVSISHPLTLDVHLLSDWSVLFQSQGVAQWSSHEVISPLVCSSMTHALTSSGPDSGHLLSSTIFSSLLGNSLYDDYSIEYWYSLCGVWNTSTVVYTRRQTRKMLQDSRSFCTVFQVTSPISRKHESDMICMEDVLQYLHKTSIDLADGPPGAGTADDAADAGDNAADGPPGANVGTVTYVTDLQLNNVLKSFHDTN
mmetsp:Transcript_24563/g.45800  ORF Transcript_24563/g.45800 Transcript_24563/m.45800 type:complete len:359 (+) Transcript_24563:229-1305(+)